MYGIFLPNFSLTDRPTDDDYMVYDMDTHRYKLTIKAVKDKLNIDLLAELDSELEANYRLDDISEKLYDLLYSYTSQTRLENNLQIKEYLMANDHKYRSELMRMQLVYMRASINTDIDVIGDEHGVDFEKGTKITFNEFDDVPKQLKRKLARSMLYSAWEYRYKLADGEYHNGY